MVKPYELARYIIHRVEKKHSITHLQLQKILYYVAGVYIAVFGKKLFSEEFEAWQYGPVVRSIYVEYSIWGALPLGQKEPVQLNVPANELKLIDFVVDMKMGLTGRQLVNDTHKESPWANHEHDIQNKPQITYEEMKIHFLNSKEVEEWKTANA